MTDPIIDPTGAIAGALKGAYGSEFPAAEADDWLADAEFVMARFQEYGFKLVPLVALATPSPDTLDVDRLHRAILDELAELWGEPSDGISAQIRPIVARNIIDRYARLSEATND